LIVVDNKPKELRSEALISHHLLKYDFKLSKPAFDQEGADLLVLDSILDKTTSFLKVQSKFRSFSDNKSTHVDIHTSYATDNFVFFLYAGHDSKEEELYTFFCEDIRSWKIVGDSYRLTVSVKSLKNYQDKIFGLPIVELLKARLRTIPIKHYTSIIIDGIFLEQAIRTTKELYRDLWPEKEFLQPSFDEIISQLLSYNRFSNVTKDVNCILFLSQGFNLDSVIDIPDPRDPQSNMDGVKLTVYKSDRIVAFEVLEHLERIINTENILLVANDIAYDKPLNDLSAKGIDIILIKLQTDLGSRLFTPFRWGDIVYPLGRALGLTSVEL
jgi:hypothetical protein